MAEIFAVWGLGRLADGVTVVGVGRKERVMFNTPPECAATTKLFSFGLGRVQKDNSVRIFHVLSAFAEAVVTATMNYTVETDTTEEQEERR